MASKFPVRLREARERAGMSQAELAKAAGLKDRRDIHQLEAREKPHKTLQTIERLAKVLGVSPAWLVGWGEAGPKRDQRRVKR
jgi:transcriptional regulator with XRE-family HTH domain